jgi:hypothetical protein
MKLSSKGLETILEGQPGLYGVAVDSKNRVFVGLDLGDKPDANDRFLGSVNRVDYDASGNAFLKPIITNIRRPRNLVFHGDLLYLILEAERVIISVNPDLPTEETGMPVVKQELKFDLPLTSANGLAIYNGRFYWGTYGEYADRNKVVGGTIQSANMTEPRDIRTLASNLGRTRGLGFDAKGNLYFTTESNVKDQGNSGILGMLTPDGNVTTLIEGLDYPQFLAVYPDGTALIPFARENFIAMYNPNLRTNRLISSINNVDIFGVNIKPGTFSATDTTLKLEFTELGKNLTFSLNLENTTGAKGGWVTVPFQALNLSPEQLSRYATELPYPVQPEVPAPGYFIKPTVKCTIGTKVCAANVLSKRTHVGWRWPMTGPEGLEKPAEGFSENPEAFFINFFW